MLLRLEDEVHWVILRMHHIISDRQSMLLFLNDLAIITPASCLMF
ncbi:hypothetical protein [Paenibacillus sp. A3M_27_13]